MGALASSLRIIHGLLLAFWIGANGLWLLMFNGMMRLDEGRHEATEILLLGGDRIDRYGQVAAPILLFTLWLGWASARISLRARAIAVGLLLISAYLRAWYFQPKLRELRGAMGRAIEDLLHTDDWVRRYDQLSHVSNGLLWLQLGLGVLLLVLAIRNIAPRRHGGIEF